MIVSILMGRAGSKGLKGKNTRKVLGRALCEYPLMAAQNSKYVKKSFVTTDCLQISKIAKQYKANIIKRSKNLCNDKALGEDVYADAYFKIKKELNKKNIKIDLVVLLMANAATINEKIIDRGISFLKKNKTFDSAVSTSVYNMWSPLRARKLTKNGSLKPFVPFKSFGNPKNLNCDRDSQGDVHYADMSVSIVRPKCLENLNQGLLPQKWMGKKIAPIVSEGGCDIDFEYQIPGVEHWLKVRGFRKK